MRILAVFSLISVGCAAGSFEPLPRQDEAVRIVWHDLYGEEGGAPPVEWVEEEAAPGAMGVTLPGWKIRVTRMDDTQADPGQPLVTRYFCGTALAHELMHYHTYLRTGDVDVGHHRGDWELADETAFWALWDAGL